jgi:hypothetical protein
MVPAVVGETAFQTGGLVVRTQGSEYVGLEFVRPHATMRDVYPGTSNKEERVGADD